MSVCFDELVHLTEKGLYCPAGDFYIDPWAPVARAIITHGHSDHARVGSSEYFAHPSTVKIMKHRFAQTGTAGLPLFENLAGLGAEPNAQMHPVPYRQSVNFSDVKVSLHPAGHILGSAQVRIEHKGKITVVSGDYKLSKVSSMALDDLTCEPFELVQCDTFITESTFALPIYKFRPTIEVVAEIFDWWVECARLGRSALLLAYSLGKAQRVLAALRQLSLSGSLPPNLSGSFPGPILVHPAVHSLCEIYRADGVELPAYQVMGRHSQARSSQGNQPSMSGSASDSSKADTFQADSSQANSYESNSYLDLESKELESGDSSSVLKNGGALIIAPPALAESKLARSANVSLGFASGWMQVRGQRRRRNVDRGFVLSDHADWQSLTKTIFATGASSVLVTHGSSGSLVRFLREHGLEANDLQTRFEGGE
jgi:putative mRNA 3-end processing factor